MTRWQTLLLAASLCGACNSTGVGNPRSESLTLSVVRDEQPEPNSGVGAAGAGATNSDDDLDAASIRHAVLVLGALHWLPCDAALPVLVVPGPFTLDLVSGATEPAFPSVDTPEGGFCGLQAPLAPALAPAALAGRSIFFDGQRADGTRFLLYADMRATLRLRRHGSAIWQGSEPPAPFLWALRPRRWLARAELASLDSVPWDGARAIVINVERHPLLYAAIRARLAGRSTLYADLRRDGTLDAEDRADGLVGDGSDQAD